MSNSIDTSALLNQLRGMAREAGVPAAALPSASARTTDASGTDFATALARGATSADGVRSRPGAASGTSAPVADVDFTALMRRSIEGVNERSGAARSLREAFESGHEDVQLVDVMIAAQKARVSFETLTQVRNKMVAAYKDIMSTPL